MGFGLWANGLGCCVGRHQIDGVSDRTNFLVDFCSPDVDFNTLFCVVAVWKNFKVATNGLVQWITMLLDAK